jgi:hypothetical protein
MDIVHSAVSLGEIVSSKFPFLAYFLLFHREVSNSRA